MGRSTTMQVKTILFFCLALLVAVWAVTEVQELGNDDSHSMQNSHESANLAAEDETDSVGESAGTGRRGGAFLSTTGSFSPRVVTLEEGTVRRRTSSASLPG